MKLKDVLHEYWSLNAEQNNHPPILRLKFFFSRRRTKANLDKLQEVMNKAGAKQNASVKSMVVSKEKSKVIATINLEGNQTKVDELIYDILNEGVKTHGCGMIHILETNLYVFLPLKVKLTDLNDITVKLQSNGEPDELKNINLMIPDAKKVQFVNFMDVKCGILGLMRIKTLENIYIERTYGGLKFTALAILNRHLQSGRDILECQEELISAGLKEYAKL